MQQPQILGILIGLFSIFVGYIARKLANKHGKDTLGGTSFTIAAFIGVTSIMQNLLFAYANSWSWLGVFMIWTEFFGAALVPIALGFIGLLYKPNRSIGYAFALVVVFIILKLR